MGKVFLFVGDQRALFAECNDRIRVGHSVTQLSDGFFQDGEFWAQFAA